MEILSFGKFDHDIKKWLRLCRGRHLYDIVTGQDGSLINPRKAGESSAQYPSIGFVSLQGFVAGALVRQKI